MSKSLDERDALLALADRCEKAEGPDRELDCLIPAAIGYEQGGTQYSVAHYIAGCGLDWLVTQADSHNSVFRELPRFTASLDAAMTLVPEGWEFTAGRTHDGKGIASVWSPDHDEWTEEAASPALALCAAALRAIALTKDTPA